MPHIFELFNPITDLIPQIIDSAGALERLPDGDLKALFFVGVMVRVLAPGIQRERIAEPE
jgi:hypothetical protein